MSLGSSANPLSTAPRQNSTAANAGGVVSVGTSNGALVAANANRLRLYVRNTHATQTVSLSLGGTAVSGQGIHLPAGAAVEIADFTGAVNAIASGASTTVAVAEV